MVPEWAERYQKRFTDFRLPKDVKERGSSKLLMN
jgi:hypothetical protein